MNSWLPLVFIIGRAFNLEDVKRIGYWTMVLAMPMAALMVLQFRSGPDSFLNAFRDDIRDAQAVAKELADSPPVRGAGLANRYSVRAPSWLTDHGSAYASMTSCTPRVNRDAVSVI